MDPEYIDSLNLPSDADSIGIPLASAIFTGFLFLFIHLALHILIFIFFKKINKKHLLYFYLYKILYL